MNELISNEVKFFYTFKRYWGKKPKAKGIVKVTWILNVWNTLLSYRL